MEFTQPYLEEVFLPLVLERLRDLAFAPFNHPDMAWIVAPMVVIVLTMNFYFGKYHQEELGWNTAFGNSLVLVFVSVDLLRYLFEAVQPASLSNYLVSPLKSLIAVGVAFEGILLLYSNYLHFLPKRLAFWVSAPLPVNLQAYLAIALVYTEIPFDEATLAAAVALFFAAYFVLKSLRLVQWGLGVGLHRAKELEEKEEIEHAREILERAKKRKEHALAEAEEIEEAAEEAEAVADAEEEAEDLAEEAVEGRG